MRQKLSPTPARGYRIQPPHESFLDSFASLYTDRVVETKQSAGIFAALNLCGHGVSTRILGRQQTTSEFLRAHEDSPYVHFSGLSRTQDPSEQLYSFTLHLGAQTGPKSSLHPLCISLERETPFPDSSRSRLHPSCSPAGNHGPFHRHSKYKPN